MTREDDDSISHDTNFQDISVAEEDILDIEASSDIDGQQPGNIASPLATRELSEAEETADSMIIDLPPLPDEDDEDLSRELEGVPVAPSPRENSSSDEEESDTFECSNRDQFLLMQVGNYKLSADQKKRAERARSEVQRKAWKDKAEDRNTKIQERKEKKQQEEAVRSVHLSCKADLQWNLLKICLPAGLVISATHVPGPRSRHEVDPGPNVMIAPPQNT